MNKFKEVFRTNKGLWVRIAVCSLFAEIFRQRFEPEPAEWWQDALFILIPFFVLYFLIGLIIKLSGKKTAQT